MGGRRPGRAATTVHSTAPPRLLRSPGDAGAPSCAALVRANAAGQALGQPCTGRTARAAEQGERARATAPALDHALQRRSRHSSASSTHSCSARSHRRWSRCRRGILCCRWMRPPRHCTCPQYRRCSRCQTAKTCLHARAGRAGRGGQAGHGLVRHGERGAAGGRTSGAPPPSRRLYAASRPIRWLAGRLTCAAQRARLAACGQEDGALADGAHVVDIHLTFAPIQQLPVCCDGVAHGGLCACGYFRRVGCA